MTSPDNLRLVATEVGCLWTQYMNDSLGRCVLRYFLSKTEDREIRPVVEFALGLSQKHLDSITQIFNNEGIPIPAGFSDEDVNPDAPRLYMDTYYLRYLRHLAKLGIAAYGLASALAVRSDIRDFYYACTQSALELNERVIQVQLSKGLFVRAPYIPTPKQVEFVQAPNFMGSLIGEKRPLTALSIMSIFPNIQTNATARTLLVGFSQTAQSPEVRDHLMRGSEITKKHIKVMNTILEDSDLPASATAESEVTDSTIPPFSDKLMMQHTTVLIGAGMGNYGLALGASTRIDIAVDYARLMGEIATYGEDGVQIMIKNRWLEQPPQAADRKELALSR